MKKRIVALLLAGCMVCLMGACSGGAGSGSGGGGASSNLNLAESNTGEKVNEDFSKNVNTNRASDYAKNELSFRWKESAGVFPQIVRRRKSIKSW